MQWEIFLRHAGLNAFAAQSVLNSFLNHYLPSEPCEDDSSGLVQKSSQVNVKEASGRSLALYTLVSMAAKERLRRLGPLAGGRRVMRKMNEVLDASWMVFS